MNGIVSGGWEFVWAAYIITAIIVFGYTARVWTGFSRSNRPAEAGPRTRRTR